MSAFLLCQFLHKKKRKRKSQDSKEAMMLQSILKLLFGPAKQGKLINHFLNLRRIQLLFHLLNLVGFLNT